MVFVASGRMVRMLSGFNRRTADPVPELGEHVLLRKDVIAIAKGDVMVSIRLRGPGGANACAALRQLAGAAMGRLGIGPPVAVPPIPDAP